MDDLFWEKSFKARVFISKAGNWTWEKRITSFHLFPFFLQPKVIALNYDKACIKQSVREVEFDATRSPREIQVVWAAYHIYKPNEDVEIHLISL